MNPKTTESILHEISNIQRMEKGTLSVIRQTANGPAYNFQRWDEGRNRSEYIPADQVSEVAQNLQAYTRFESLVAEYLQSISARSRQERLAGVKKKRQSPISPSPRKPRSKT